MQFLTLLQGWVSHFHVFFINHISKCSGPSPILLDQSLNNNTGLVFGIQLMRKKKFQLFKKIANSMTQSRDAGGKDLALSSVYSLLIYFVVKQAKSSLSSASSSFLTVCTDGRDIVETAEKGVKVFDTGQFDFYECSQERIEGTEKASPIHTLFHR